MSATKKTQLSRLIPYLMRFKWRVLFSIALIISSKILAVSDPYIIKKLIDTLVSQGTHANIRYVLMLVGLFFALRWGSSILDGVKDYILAKADTTIKRLISLDVFKHLLDLSVDFHTNRATGGIARKITRGTAGMETMVWILTNNIVPTFIEIILVLIIFLRLFPISFALVIIGFIATYVSYTVFTTERRQKLLIEANKLDDESSGRSIDALMNYETVKYFTNEEFEHARFDSALKRWGETAIKSARTGANLNMGQGFIITTGLSALLYLGLNQFMQGRASVGDFVLVTTYLSRIAIPMNFLGFIYRRLKEALADIDGMFQLMSVDSAVKDMPGAVHLESIEGHVEFKKVDFGYTKERVVLHDLSIDFSARKSTALVGYSGSGKSTISKLLLRFYDVTGGTILIDGKDIRDVTQRSLREHIGVVAQDSVLFNDTIYSNIGYGKPGALREDVIAAAKLANIHDFIIELPQGYDTIVGERGVKLSGGERQRVAIARILLKNPSVLLFDEATASLDSASEKMIQDAIAKISHGGRTTIVIAHRLSTIVDFDTIVVLDRGRVVETGTHRELLQSGTVYRKLWEIQSRTAED